MDATVRKVTQSLFSVSFLAILSGCVSGVNSASVVIPDDPCILVDGRAAPPPRADLYLPPQPAAFAGRSAASGQGLSDLERGRMIVNGTFDGGRADGDQSGYRTALETGLGTNFDELRGIPVTEDSADHAEEVIKDLNTFRAKLLDRSDSAAAGVGGGGRSASNAAAKPEVKEITFKRSEWEEMNEKIANSSTELGWASAAVRQIGAVANANGRADVAEAAKKRLLIADYMLAYFRYGKLLTVDFNDIPLKAKADAEADKIKAADVRKAVKDAFSDAFKAYRAQLCTKATTDGQPCQLLDYSSAETFVTRSGAAYAFSKVTGTIDLTKSYPLVLSEIDWKAGPPDLIRVTLEALGDETSDVPGVASSTLCKLRADRCATAAADRKMEIVNRAGDVTEASTTSIAGAAIRGGWIISLNNEVLADTMTAAIAVSLRKAAEVAMWRAVDQCGLGGRNAAGEAGNSPSFRKITLKFE